MELKKTDFAIATLLALAVVIRFVISTPYLLDTRPTPYLLESYLRSQDIVHDVENRVHISDSHIYYASGVLYALGADPTVYNFQHPPLVKYLFGFSGIIFNSPFYIQLLFAIAIPVLIYLTGVKLGKKLPGALASLLVFIDPLFIQLQSELLLDLGLAAFVMTFLYVCLFYPKQLTLQGILLAAAAATKFWSTAVFVGLLTWVFLFTVMNKLSAKDFTKTAFISAITFCAVYLRSFTLQGLHFNIVFWQAKMLKFLLHHDSSEQLGGAIVLFLTGTYKSWWSGNQLLVSDTWSVLWPITLIIVLIYLVTRRKFDTISFYGWLGIIYLVFISKGVPFARYFIVSLPIMYLSAVIAVSDLLARFYRLYRR